MSRAAVALVVVAACATSAAPTTDWRVTGGDPGNTRYSTLDQINTQNVARLQVAWTYHTGDLPPNGHGEIQATPIVVDGVLYTTTPALAVIALRADRGTLIWKFDPRTTNDARRTAPNHVNRGVVYWADGNDRRIFFSAGRRLYALDAATGRPVPTFGDSGSIDLAAGLSRDVGDAYLVATTPGAIYKDVLIQGTRVGEEEGSAPGDVRAYDVRTGAIRWSFHTIPRPGEVGYDTWPDGAWRTAGGANSWAGMSVDQQRGIVYVPTGSATPDFYGGARAGANLFANSLLALDASTGKRLWHFQTVHHDLWDRDLPAAPNLVTLTRHQSCVDAVAQIAKSGFVFVFDRDSGKPLFPIEERPVPRSELAGEHAWPTQPHPLQPQPFARQAIRESDVTNVKRFRTLRTGLFMPPTRQGTVVLPGFDGGGEWGGAAVDPDGVLYVNASDVPWIAAMRESARIPPSTGRPRSGAAIYADVCASCHGIDAQGRDRAPALSGIHARLPLDAVKELLQWGRGFMPSFANLPGTDRRAVLEYLGYAVPPSDTASRPRHATSPFEFVGYERWRDSSGYPAIKPPWGTLSAIDLNTGEYRWRIPLGEFADLTARGVPVTGTEMYGGPIVTAGGLVFIAATQDSKFRAFDKNTGQLLWETPLPAPGYATPSTFAVKGKQFVVIAAGGGKLGSKSSDAYVAYALPATQQQTWMLGPFTKPAEVNPVITPNPDARFRSPMNDSVVAWEAYATFNPAAVAREGKVFLLYRAEDASGKEQIGGHTSRIGLAESSDGLRFTRRPTPVLYPDKDAQRQNEWPGGVEDPRVVESEDGTYILTYTQWNRDVPRLAVATSRDLVTWTKHGPAFARAAGGKYLRNESKSGAILSRVESDRIIATRVNGKYWMYWGVPTIRLATSENLLDWTPVEDSSGVAVVALGPRPRGFDSWLVEAGPPALLMPAGIVVLYNAGDSATRSYSAGQALFDRKNPMRLLARSDTFFIKPTKAYERTGQYAAGTTFVEALVPFKGKVFLYYGTADSRVGVAVWDPSKE